MQRRNWRLALAASVAVLAITVLSGWLYWLGFDLQRAPPGNAEATVAQLAFLQQPPATRGRLLAVVSSAARIGDSGRRGGYELTELARAYYVFVANGFEVDVASPAGGRAPAVIDDDLTDVDYAFLNDPVAQRKVRGTLRLADVDPARYAGVFFVGGKGAMVDFPGAPEIARIVRDVDARGGVIAAVCHGPAALLGVTGANGLPLLQGRRVTAFSNAEELFLIDDAQAVFGALLQDRLVAQGADFVEAPMYLDNTVVDGRLVTGQNPWSTWSTAEAMVTALGHAPVPRPETAEEQAVRVLAAYREGGYAAARRVWEASPGADTRLVLLHALIAAMQGQWRDAFWLQRVARG